MTATTITLAAFLQLAGANCPIAPQTLAAITLTESRLAGTESINPLAINVNGAGGGTVRGIHTRAQAMAKAHALIRAGRDFDAGLGQINVRNWAWLGLTVETVFDPVQNIQAQCRLLQYYSRYNTGSPIRGVTNGYAGKVAANGARMRAEGRQVAPAPAAPVSSCPGLPPTWDALGRAARVARCRSGTIVATLEEYP